MSRTPSAASLIGTLDEKYLSPKAFGIMHNHATWFFAGSDLRGSDGAIDLDAIKARVDDVAQDYPILRQRLAPTPLRITTPAWVTEPTLDLDHHVRLCPRVVVDDPLHAESITGAGFPPLDARRPLWDLHVAELSSGEVALMLRIHHAMGDGVTMVQILLALAAATPVREPAKVAAQPDEPRAPSGIGILSESAKAWLTEYPPYQAAAKEYWRKPFDRRLRRWARRLATPLGSVDESVEAPAPFSAYTTLGLSQAKDAARALGGSLNDAVVASTLMGVAEARPELAEICLMVPFSKGRPATSRNHVSGVPVTWRRGDTLAETVASVSARMRAAFRGEIDNSGPAPIGYATYMLWSRRKQCFGGVEIKRILGWPTVDPSADVGCLATGYADELTVGLRSAHKEELATMIQSIRSALTPAAGAE